MKRILAMIMAGGEGNRLSVLTEKRAKPAIPFAGRYRIIDFALSNCVNSGIFDVGVLTQYRPHSLNEHIGLGEPWDLDRSLSLGVKLLPPYRGRRDSDWYRGTADAVMQNLDFIRRGNPDLVLVLAGDHIYKMDFRELLAFHLEKEAHATVAVTRVAWQNAHLFGTLSVDQGGQITSFVEKPPKPLSNLASMGIYVFNPEVLDRVLKEDSRRPGSTHDFGRDIIPSMIEEGRIYAFPYHGYWVDVGAVETYWQAQMDLLVDKPALDLHDRQWPIYTRSRQRPPVQIKAGAKIADSLVTDGAYIAGQVERSILSPGVQVEAGALVRESVVMNDTVIESGAIVERTVLDKSIIIGKDCQIGAIGEGKRLAIAVVGKNSRLPVGMRIGAGAVIGCDMSADDFPRKVIGRGSRVTLSTSS